MAARVEHIVIIVKENHTFDNYFGTFKRAGGAKEKADLLGGRRVVISTGRHIDGELSGHQWERVERSRVAVTRSLRD